MGAHDFTEVVRNISDVRRAYDNACEEALREHGHDAYNGTISTTSGVTIIEATPMSLARAQKRADEIMDDSHSHGIEKWGNAGAIALTPGGKEEKRSKKVTLDAVEYASYEKGNQGAILAHLKPLKGYEIIRINVGGVDLTTKVTTQATEGERETRYLIEGTRQHNTWETGFESQAKARAHIDAVVKEQDISSPFIGKANASWGIYAVTRRASGKPLVVTRRQVKRAVLDVDYYMEQIVTGKQDGWMFFGWAAS